LGVFGRLDFHRLLARPTAQPAQRGVDRQPLDQARGRGQVEHGLGDKRARQPMAIFRRPPQQTGPHLNERRDPRHIEHDHQPLVLRGQRSGLVPQHREQKASNVVPAVC